MTATSSSGVEQLAKFEHSGTRPIHGITNGVGPSLVHQGTDVKHRISHPAIVICALLATQSLFPAFPQPNAPVRVLVRPALESLLKDEDTDGDKRITIDDPHREGTYRGDKRFWLHTIDGHSFEVSGTYHLANLLAFLKRAEDDRRDTIDIRISDLYTPPADHIAEAIAEKYWHGLTRMIDKSGLTAIFRDEKTRSKNDRHFVYVPAHDTMAFKYFSNVGREDPALRMVVVRLPDTIGPVFMHSLEGKHGVLSLALRKGPGGTLQGAPFVVPGGRFNEMYGWDSYFITIGLLETGRIDLARSMVENFVYEINNYGKILNANRTYYLTRSQPPFLTSMALAVFDSLPKNEASREWLAAALEAAIEEYRNVWMAPPHLTPLGLSRYYDSGVGPPPEVEPGRFDDLFAHEASLHHLSPDEFRRRYVAGTLKDPVLDKFFTDDRSMRESGHDASYRLQDDCAELVTVDLNSLLYKIEMDLAHAIKEIFNGKLTLRDGTTVESGTFERAAEHRRSLMMQYLWEEKRGMFFDYDFVEGKQMDFVSATTLYPLWAGIPDNNQAQRLVSAAIPLLAMPGGIVGSTEASRGPITRDHPQTQWDYPFGWAPHQMLIGAGLRRYGYAALANDLAYRWLYTIAVNAANYNGTIAEKYDVVIRSSQVFAEYGNVGTKFSYLTREGFGWTNASFVSGRKHLSAAEVKNLNRLVPPEWIYPPLATELRPNH